MIVHARHFLEVRVPVRLPSSSDFMSQSSTSPSRTCPPKHQTRLLSHWHFRKEENSSVPLTEHAASIFRSNIQCCSPPSCHYGISGEPCSASSCDTEMIARLSTVGSGAVNSPLTCFRLDQPTRCTLAFDLLQGAAGILCRRICDLARLNLGRHRSPRPLIQLYIGLANGIPFGTAPFTAGYPQCSRFSGLA